MIQDKKEYENRLPLHNDYGLTSYMMLHSCRNIIINELIIRILDKSNYSIEYR